MLLFDYIVVQICNKALYTNSMFSVTNCISTGATILTAFFDKTFPFTPLDIIYNMFYDSFYQEHIVLFFYVLNNNSPAVFHRFLQAILAHRQRYQFTFYLLAVLEML